MSVRGEAPRAAEARENLRDLWLRRLPMASRSWLLLIPLLGGCYDDMSNRMKIIDGKTDRLIHARMVLDAAAAACSGEAPTASALEQIDVACQQGLAAYGEILDCEDEGTCRRGGLRQVCADAAALLEAREALAPHAESFAVAEQLSASRGPMTAERLAARERQMQADGNLTAFEADILTLASAAAAAHSVRALPPVGAREAERRRRTHAIDAFHLRGEASA